jgi:hypothetical protein
VLLKEIIAVRGESYAKQTNIKWRVYTGDPT